VYTNTSVGSRGGTDGRTGPIEEPDKRAGGQRARLAAASATGCGEAKKQSTQNPRPL